VKVINHTMATPVPQTTDAWLSEVKNHFEVAAMAAAGDALDETPDQARWVAFIQRQAINTCRNLRGLTVSFGAPEKELDELEAVDEIAHALRDELADTVRDVVSEIQLYLLFYAAAHVRTSLLSRSDALQVVKTCWEACAAGCNDSPWPIGNEPPGNSATWTNEIITAFGATPSLAPLPLADGTSFSAASLLEAAIVSALINRASTPDQAAVFELRDSIRAMEVDVSTMGPEWQDMCRIPAMAFAMYYVWVHLAIGLMDEAMAMNIMQECTRRISEFPDPSVND
jgi:hypothetical protein